MANKNLLTTYAKNSQVQLTAYAPVAYIPTTTSPLSTIFVCLSRIHPWGSDTNPDQPTQDQQYLKSVFSNMFVAKQVTTNNISPVLRRINWTSGIVYDYYQDNVDMFQVDTNGYPILQYYVKNRYDQVFKCLWNAGGDPSTSEPFFQPGFYSDEGIFQGPDGYKWKYIYTIDIGSKKTFMDENWMPVPIGTNIPNPLQNSSGRGNIPVINVTNGGSGYDTVNAAVTVVVTGDGTGAAATASVANGAISDIVVTNSGTDYTYANVSIVSTLGSSATAIAPVSPVGGHGLDPVSDLGCIHVMITAEFNGSESGIIPTDVDYRQVSVLVNPMSSTSYPYPANGAIYKTTTDLSVAAGFGDYVSDEIIYQGTSLETATFKASVLSFDTATNVLHIINKVGTPVENSSITGNTTKTTRTLLSVTPPDWVPYSGYLTDIQNRSGIQRSSDGIEQFKFVLGF